MSFKNVTEYKICVLSYSEHLSIILLMLKMIQGDINIRDLLEKYPTVFFYANT